MPWPPPSHIRKSPADMSKTDRRNAVMLAQLNRVGNLTTPTTKKQPLMTASNNWNNWWTSSHWTYFPGERLGISRNIDTVLCLKLWAWLLSIGIIQRSLSITLIVVSNTRPTIMWKIRSKAAPHSGACRHPIPEHAGR